MSRELFQKIVAGAALLLAGVLFCREYFDGADATEVAVRAYADKTEAIQREVALRRRNAAKRKKLSDRDEAILKEGIAAWVAQQMELAEGWEYDPGVAWDDIAGLATVKALVKEIVVWPMLNPSIFRGARAAEEARVQLGILRTVIALGPRRNVFSQA